MEILGYDLDHFPDDLRTVLVREGCRFLVKEGYKGVVKRSKVAWEHRSLVKTGALSLALSAAQGLSQTDGNKGSFAHLVAANAASNQIRPSSTTWVTAGATTSLGPITGGSLLHHS